jgi:3-deoxy-D-manno-octulosonic-acid transferase
MWQRVIFFFYTLGIHVGNLYVFFGSFFSPKLKLLYIGRKQTLSLLQKQDLADDEIVWIHCASLGEFEQGRPIIESIKKKYPNYKIVLSFFSPSGYEIRKSYPFADHIIYLPSDLPAQIKSLVNHFRPKVFILVKYEFWWNLILTITKTKCKIYLISGIFRKDDYFLRTIFKPFRQLLSKFDCIFVQDAESASILASNNITQHQIVGDTRIDRAISNTENVIIPARVKDFVKGTKVIVYGSVWTSDMHIVNGLVAAFPSFKHIIAPHDIGNKNIDHLIGMIPKPTCLYSNESLDTDILIINNIGMLSSLYDIANFAYIGGGFQRGIHNTLEPTVFGIPVYFGPKHQKFNEAVTLNKIGAAFGIKTLKEISESIQHLEQNPSDVIAINIKIQKYFDENKGATDKIVGHLFPLT